MLRHLFYLAICCLALPLSAQEISTPYKTKKVTISTEPVRIDSVSINKVFFKVLDASGAEIDTSYYDVDFQKSTISFSKEYKSTDSLTIRYLKYPEYLTRKYSIYDQNRVVSNEAGGNLIKI